MPEIDVYVDVYGLGEDFANWFEIDTLNNIKRWLWENYDIDIYSGETSVKIKVDTHKDGK